MFHVEPPPLLSGKLRPGGLDIDCGDRRSVSCSSRRGLTRPTRPTTTRSTGSDASVLTITRAGPSAATGRVFRRKRPLVVFHVERPDRPLIGARRPDLADGIAAERTHHSRRVFLVRPTPCSRRIRSRRRRRGFTASQRKHFRTPRLDGPSDDGALDAVPRGTTRAGGAAFRPWHQRPRSRLTSACSPQSAVSTPSTSPPTRRRHRRRCQS